MSLKVSRDALEIDELLRARARADAEKFAPLAELAKKHAEEPEKEEEAKSGNWHDKIAKMRETHPNAFKPWSAEDDGRLKKLFDDGIKLDELVKEFGRHPGSIRARLKKHYGEEVQIKS